MNERFPTKTEERRPGFHPERIKTKADLEKYREELLEWSNTQDLDVQKAHIEFAEKLKELLEADEDPTEEQITELHEKLPVVEKKERLSPEVLGRYYQRVLGQLGLLRENAKVSHSELYQKNSDQRDDKYAELYGRLTALGNRIEKIQNDPDSVPDEEIKDIFKTLSEDYNYVKIKYFESGLNQQYKELVDQIDSNDELSDESKLDLKQRAEAAHDKCKTAIRDAREDGDGDDASSMEDEISKAIEKWSAQYSEILRKTSPEYQKWLEERSKFIEAKEEWFNEFEESQKKNKGIRGFFNSKEKSEKLEEAGKEFEKREQSFERAAKDYYTDSFESLKKKLISNGQSPDKAEAFVQKRIDRLKGLYVGRGINEGEKLATLESDKGWKVAERFATLQEKYNNLSRWTRLGVGVVVIGGTGAVAGLALSSTAPALAVSVMVGAGKGALSFSKPFAEWRRKKEQVKVDAKEVAYKKAREDALSHKVEDNTAAAVRRDIKNRRRSFLQSVRDQKVRSANSGFLGGAVAGGALGSVFYFGTNAAKEAVEGLFSGDEIVPSEELSETDKFATTKPLSINPDDYDMGEVVGENTLDTTPPEVQDDAPEVFEAPDSDERPDLPSSEPEVPTYESPETPPVSSEEANQLGGENYKSDSKSAADFLKNDTNEVAPAPEPQPETEATPELEPLPEIEPTPETSQPGVGAPGEETIIENVATDLETLTHETVKGDWVSKKLIDFYPQYFADLSESQWNEFIASVENNPELLKSAGVSSGDLDLIKPGEEIRYDVLAEHYINNVTGEGLRDAVVPAPEAVPEPGVQTGEVAPEVIDESELASPTENPNAVSAAESMLAGQPEEVIAEVNSRIDSSMSGAEQAELVGTILERNALINAMEGEASKGVMATLNDMSVTELDNAIKQGGFASWLSENGLADAKFAAMLRQMSEAGLLKGDSLYEAIENSMNEGRLRLVSNGLGEESVQVRRVGLFGTKGGWNAPINSFSA